MWRASYNFIATVRGSTTILIFSRANRHGWNPRSPLHSNEPPYSLRIQTMISKFHPNSFFRRITLLWISLAKRCVHDHYNLSPEITVICPSYSYKIILNLIVWYSDFVKNTDFPRICSYLLFHGHFKKLCNFVVLVTDFVACQGKRRWWTVGKNRKKWNDAWNY